MKNILGDFRTQIEQIIHTTKNKIDMMGAKLQLQMQKIDDDVLQLRNNFNQTKEEIKRIDFSQEISKKRIKELEIRRNITEQLALENQIMMMNLAPTISKEKLIQGMNAWTNKITKSNSIKRINLVTKENKSTVADYLV
ncbi:unnamed protein product [Chironomus riparius]|uniref:Uncharacterized protein n=1 Tax=Chironomus riparius TaxID=315576 RepID=A0A9P0NNI6_9DIPT|nr:unnamed protein product [Chironomus riparius]